jgi:hypothetical protein
MHRKQGRGVIPEHVNDGAFGGHANKPLRKAN